MSISTELFRLQKSKDVLGVVGATLLADVRKWHRLELQVAEEVMPNEADRPDYLGGGVWRLKRATQTTFRYDADAINVYNGHENMGNGYISVCFVILPVGEEHIGIVAHNDTDDGVSPDAVSMILTEDLTREGIITDEEIYLYYDEAALTFQTHSDEHDTDLFIGVYSRYNESIPVIDENGYDTGERASDYVNGTESMDELAVSLYKWAKGQ